MQLSRGFAPARQTSLRRAAAGTLFLAGLALTSACSDSSTTPDATPEPDLGSGGRDASRDAPDERDTGADTAAAPPEPEAPALPQLTDWTCPEGWVPREVLEGTPLAHSVCEPPPVPESCPEGEMAVLGSAKCQPVGDPCPEGDFPEDLLPGAVTPDAPVLFVLAGAAEGGDGLSPETAFERIGDAVAAAPDGATIAVGKGSYAEDVELALPVTLRGACAAQTRVTGGVADDSRTLGVVRGTTGVTVENLTLEGGSIGLIVESTASFVGRGLVIREARGQGVRVNGTAELTGVVIQDTQASAGGGPGGFGVFAPNSARLTLRASVVERSIDAGIVAFIVTEGSDGPQLELSDVIVRDTRLDPFNDEGQGIRLGDGATVTATRVLIEGNAAQGVALKLTNPDLAPPSLALSDAVIRRTQPRSVGDYGIGALASGAVLRLTRVVVSGNSDTGIYGLAAAEISLTDVLVEDTQPRAADGFNGDGIFCDSSALTLSRTVLLGNRVTGLSAGTEEGQMILQAADLVVVGTRAAPEDQAGESGLVLQNVTAPEPLERLYLDGNTATGVIVLPTARPDFTLQLEDLTVVDTAAGPRGTLGIGASIGGGALELRRAAFTGNRTSGLHIGHYDEANLPPEVSLEDVRFSGTLADGRGAFGDALDVVGDVAVTLSRLRVEGSARAGIASFKGARVSVADTRLDCNRIQLDSEKGEITDADGNLCGCAEEIEVCGVVSSALMPPDPPPVSHGPRP